MRAWGSIAAVIATVRDDAAAEIERLERDHEAWLAQLRAQTAIAPEAPERAARIAAARARAAEQDAEEDWLDVESVLLEREAWMARVVAEGRAQLQQVSSAAAVRRWVAMLATEGARHVPGTTCSVVVSSAVAPLLDGSWRADLERDSGKQIAVEVGDIEGGCVVRAPDGASMFDNSIDALVRRTEVVWRATLARVFHEASTTEPIAAASAPENRP